MRFQVTCENAQNSIKVTESHMGEQQQLTFDINKGTYTLAILKSTRRILQMEKTKGRVEMKIKRKDEINTMKKELKHNHQKRKSASNPNLKRRIKKKLNCHGLSKEV